MLPAVLLYALAAGILIATAVTVRLVFRSGAFVSPNELGSAVEPVGAPRPE